MQVVFYLNHNGRARHVHGAVVAGLARHGLTATTRHPSEFKRSGIEADIAIFYGLWAELKEIQKAYPAASKTSVLISGLKVKRKSRANNRFRVFSYCKAKS